MVYNIHKQRLRADRGGEGGSDGDGMVGKGSEPRVIQTWRLRCQPWCPRIPGEGKTHSVGIRAMEDRFQREESGDMGWIR